MAKKDREAKDLDLGDYYRIGAQSWVSGIVAGLIVGAILYMIAAVTTIERPMVIFGLAYIVLGLPLVGLFHYLWWGWGKD